MTIEEIREVAEIVAHMLKKDAPDASDVKNEMEFRRAEVLDAKEVDKEIRLDHTNNKVDIVYNGNIVSSKTFSCLSDAVFYLNKHARKL